MSIISKIKSSSRATLFLSFTLLAIFSVIFACISYRITDHFYWVFELMLWTLLIFVLPILIFFEIYDQIIKKISKKKSLKRQPCCRSYSFLHVATLVFVWVLSLTSIIIIGFIIIFYLYFTIPFHFFSNGLTELWILLLAAIVCTFNSIINGRQCLYLRSFIYGMVSPLLLLTYLMCIYYKM